MHRSLLARPEPHRRHPTSYPTRCQRRRRLCRPCPDSSPPRIFTEPSPTTRPTTSDVVIRPHGRHRAREPPPEPDRRRRSGY
ncbi:hypothetical protein ATKI12_0347 [Kitasatospora sp. Ki12]